VLPLRDHLPARTVPFVNYLLIAANVLVFGFEGWLQLGGISPEAFPHAFGVIPAAFAVDPVGNASTLVTAMFVHGGLEHLAGNMLFLWIFGDNVEDALGHFRYLVFYLACGVVAALSQVLFSVSSAVPVIGASGAIAGVLAAYLVFYPRSPITVLNPIFLLWFFFGLFFYLPAWFVILEFFAANLWSALHTVSGPNAGGVAFMEHVGGFLGGLFLQGLMRRQAPRDYDHWTRLAARRR
jgi:membrane associated rhomboid family serine protease